METLDNQFYVILDEVWRLLSLLILVPLVAGDPYESATRIIS
jgi:hypothetical protein